MFQKIGLQALVYASGLMAGILIESRLCQPHRPTALQPSNPASMAAPTTAPTPPNAGPTPIATTVATTSNASIHVEEQESNFGTAETGSRVHHVFVVKNVGTEPLVIHQVQAGCGCTTTDLGQKQIAPGESTDLKMTFDLTGRVGKQNTAVTVVSNDSKHPNLRLSMVGEVTSRITLLPMGAEFGRVPEIGVSDPRPVQIDIAPGTPIHALKVESAHPSIAAQLEEIKAGSVYKVHVGILPGAKSGPLRSQVRVMTDGASPYQQITVPVQAYIGAGGPVLAGDELEISGSTIGGGSVDLKALKGKVCVVVFWASWCGHCQAEIPELVALYQQYHDDGLEIVGVNSDKAVDQAAAAMKKFKVPWPNIGFTAANGVESNPIFTKYNISGIPATFIVDRRGRVASIGLRKTGLKSKVEQLLKEEKVAANP